MQKLTSAAVLGVVAMLATSAFTTDDGGGPEPVERVDELVVSAASERAGDWNAGTGADIGAALGQDLVDARIAYGDDVFTFVIGLAALPPIGGAPEVTRYGWSFTYNGEKFELDGKFTNYSRGACDPTAGSCPPPQDPGLQTFLVRGNCVTDADTNVTTCQELGRVQASFDPDAATITIPIPAGILAGETGVRGCDVIKPLGSFFNDGTSVWAAPSAFFTRGANPADTMRVVLPFEIPPADETYDCDA